MNNEYSKSAVGANGCAYSTLDAYNQNYFGKGYSGAPTLSQTRSQEIVITPSFGSPGYSVGAPTCSGYQPLTNAYPCFPGGCGHRCGEGNPYLPCRR
jgi:hypothetical protein